jgi:hypothetical protein
LQGDESVWIDRCLAAGLACGWLVAGLLYYVNEYTAHLLVALLLPTRIPLLTTRALLLTTRTLLSNMRAPFLTADVGAGVGGDSSDVLGHDSSRPGGHYHGHPVL